jgi:hypothetical protein
MFISNQSPIADHLILESSLQAVGGRGVCSKPTIPKPQTPNLILESSSQAGGGQGICSQTLDGGRGRDRYARPPAVAVREGRRIGQEVRANV